MTHPQIMIFEYVYLILTDDTHEWQYINRGLDRLYPEFTDALSRLYDEHRGNYPCRGILKANQVIMKRLKSQ